MNISIITETIPLQFRPGANLVIGVGAGTLDLQGYVLNKGFPFAEKDGPEKNVEVEGYTYSDNESKNYYLLVHRFSSVGYVAHEVRHFLNFVYVDIGFKLKAKNDELDCYLMTYFVDVVCEVQVKALKKFKSK